MAKTQQVQCPYCSGTGIGAYWLHSLTDTIDTKCHWCDGVGTCTPGAAKMCYKCQLNEDRQADYKKNNPHMF